MYILRRLMCAAGSLIDLIPSTEYEKLVPPESIDDALHSDLQAVGDDIRASMASVEVKEKKAR